MSDDRIDILAKAMRAKHYELNSDEGMYANKYFHLLAEECLKTLDEYYGAARYWMSAEFEREKILNELETTMDRIRNAGTRPIVWVRE